jgi:hypothetical protein
MAWLMIPLAVLGLFEVGFIYALCAGTGGFLQAVGLGLVSWFLFCVIRGHIKAWQRARIFPYYDKRLPSAKTYLCGQAILKNCLCLDRLAEENGVKAISSYGFPDALRGEKVIWHNAIDGLKTIEELLKVVSKKPETVDEATKVTSDLEKIRSAFQDAQRDGIKFSFLIEDMGGTSGLVWERRKGFV